jgi:hypothetical protein
MENWPKDHLPDPVDSNYAGELAVSVNRAKFDSNYVRQVLRNSQERVALSLQWSFTKSQYRLFRAFVASKLNNGADQFYIELWFGDIPQEVVARFVNGTYQFTYNEGLWNVSAVLEIDEVPTLSESDYEEIVEISEDPELLMLSLTRFNTFVDESFYEHLT